MRTKAAVPLKTEMPTMGLHSNKNFVTTNAIQAILSKPKQMPEDFRYFTYSFPSLPLVCFPYRVRFEYVLCCIRGLFALYSINAFAASFRRPLTSNCKPAALATVQSQLFCVTDQVDFEA